MAYRILSPRFSFIQFDTTDIATSCAGDSIQQCLPVYSESDIAFQFVVEADTTEEADDLCDLSNSVVEIGIRDSCSDVLTPFTSKSERYRISDLQVLYNWQHGIENLNTLRIGQCFHIGIDIDVQSFCSNCLQRIGDDCYTSVVEYGNEENAFGFNYCNSGTDVESEIDCSPTIISFTNQSSLVIPYTASLQAKYGVVPTVQTWLYNPAGELQDMGITAKFNTYPPTQIIFDFGGPGSGIVKIL